MKLAVAVALLVYLSGADLSSGGVWLGFLAGTAWQSFTFDKMARAAGVRIR